MEHAFKVEGHLLTDIFTMTQSLLENGSSLSLTSLEGFRKLQRTVPPLLVYLDGVIVHITWY